MTADFDINITFYNQEDINNIIDGINWHIKNNNPDDYESYKMEYIDDLGPINISHAMSEGCDNFDDEVLDLVKCILEKASEASFKIDIDVDATYAETSVELEYSNYELKAKKRTISYEYDEDSESIKKSLFEITEKGEFADGQKRKINRIFSDIMPF